VKTRQNGNYHVTERGCRVMSRFIQVASADVEASERLESFVVRVKGKIFWELEYKANAARSTELRSPKS